MNLSIITVVRNGMPKVKSCVASVNHFMQESDLKIEHIIQCASSSDGSEEYLRSLEYRADRLIYIEPDQGIYDAMNKAIAKASGDFLFHLNADDLLLEDAKDYITCGKLTNHIDLLTFGVRIDGEKHYRIWRPAKSKFISFFGMLPPHTGCIFRKEHFYHAGMYNTSYDISADTDLLIKLKKNISPMRTLEIPEILVKMSSGGISNRGIFHKSFWKMQGEDYKIFKTHKRYPLLHFVLKKLSKLSQVSVKK